MKLGVQVGTSVSTFSRKSFHRGLRRRSRRSNPPHNNRYLTKWHHTHLEEAAEAVVASEAIEEADEAVDVVVRQDEVAEVCEGILHLRLQRLRRR
jgi:hypothetical protein